MDILVKDRLYSFVLYFLSKDLLISYQHPAKKVSRRAYVFVKKIAKVRKCHISTLMSHKHLEFSMGGFLAIFSKSIVLYDNVIFF